MRVDVGINSFVFSPWQGSNEFDFAHLAERKRWIHIRRFRSACQVSPEGAPGVVVRAWLGTGVIVVGCDTHAVG